MAAALVATVVAAGGLAGSAWVKSPADQAAQTRPPDATVLTAPVVRKVLTNVVTVRGAVSAGGGIAVTPQASRNSADASTATSTLVVSKITAKAGDQVSPGGVLIEVSGRPVVILQGAVPAYRDLKPNATGTDVAQLQTALAAAGFRTGSDTLGTFGSGTKDAISAFYRHIGYPVPTTGGSGSSDVMMPANEVVFVPDFPTRVEKLNVQLGQDISGPALILDTGALTVSSVLQPGQNDLVKAGMKVSLDAELLGDQTVGATVTEVGTVMADQGGAPGGQDQNQQAGGGAPANALQVRISPRQTVPGYPLLITPDAPLPATWAGQDVRVTVSGAATDGPVLAVPVSALSTGADSRTSVTVVGPDGSQRRVFVTAGTSADGDVQVSPSEPDALKEGDNVVVGQAAS